VYVRDNTMVGVYALLLFGGELKAGASTRPLLSPTLTVVLVTEPLKSTSVTLKRCSR
jgi:hypothetical protein